MFNKDITDALSRIESLLRLRAKQVERPFLVTYQWSNSFTDTSGFGSVIVTLKAGEKMDADRIKQLQKDTLAAISETGHNNDPDGIIIVSVSRLEK